MIINFEELKKVSTTPDHKTAILIKLPINTAIKNTNTDNSAQKVNLDKDYTILFDL